MRKTSPVQCRYNDNLIYLNIIIILFDREVHRFVRPRGRAVVDGSLMIVRETGIRRVVGGRSVRDGGSIVPDRPVDQTLRRVVRWVGRHRHVSRRASLARVPETNSGICSRGIGHRQVIRGMVRPVAELDTTIDRKRVSEFFATLVPFQTVHRLDKFVRLVVGSTGCVYRILDPLTTSRPQVYGRLYGCRQIAARTPI